MMTCKLSTKTQTYTILLQGNPPPVLVFSPPPSNESPRLYYTGMPDVVLTKINGRLVFKMVTRTAEVCNYEEVVS